MSVHRVVIVGGGFAGLNCARGLAKTNAEITLIDRRNFHLFQPLLYQVATGGLSPANIAAPLRSILKYQKNVRTIQAEVKGLDAKSNEVLLTDGTRVGFDSLVLAAGSTHHYFGKDAEWEPLAPGLKTIEDATEIRRKILTAFELAEKSGDIQDRPRLLTFVVVGGGPTGVEMAGAIAELARQTLRREFRTITPGSARIVLVENSDRILQMFPEKLSHKAAKALIEIGVELKLSCKVTRITTNDVEIHHVDNTTEILPTATVIWAAGVKASPLGKILADAIPGLTLDKGGRVPVSDHCSIANHPNLFVIGDMANFPGPDGKPLPGVAPVAMQQGSYVAEVIDRKIRQQSPLMAFRYNDKGSLATIGRSKAIGVVSGYQLSGSIAWLAWLLIHILYLARFENRILVMFQWFWNYITRNRTARLITGHEVQK